MSIQPGVDLRYVAKGHCISEAGREGNFAWYISAKIPGNATLVGVNL